MPFFAALIPAAIAGAASIGGALIGKSTADKQAQAQKDASAKIDAYGAPYRAAGTNALASYTNATGQGGAAGSAMALDEFKNSPLYQMTYQPALDAATREVQSQGSAGGFLDSGRTLKALQDRAARIGGQTYGNYLGELQHQADMGQNAAFGSGTQVQTGTNALSSAYGAAGDATAAGVLGVTNAAQKGIGNFNALAGSSYAPPPPQFAAKGQPLY